MWVGRAREGELKSDDRDRVLSSLLSIMKNHFNFPHDPLKP